MPWGDKQSATQKTSITTEVFFDLIPLMDPGELHDVHAMVDFPASPVDDAIIAVYGTLDTSAEDWDDEPLMEFTIPGADNAEIKKSFDLVGKFKYRIGVRRSGTTTTFDSADLELREDGVSA